MDRAQLGRLLNLSEELIPVGRPNRSGRRLAPTSITMHNTANEGPGADALAHSRFVRQKGFHGNHNFVSWHYTVDDERAIKQLPLNERGIHAGSGNASSLAIEICMHRGIDQAEANLRAARLVAALLFDLGLNESAVRTHQSWTGKNCPSRLLSDMDGFIDEVRAIRGSLTRGGVEAVAQDLVLDPDERREIEAERTSPSIEAPDPNPGEIDHDAVARELLVEPSSTNG